MPLYNHPSSYNSHPSNSCPHHYSINACIFYSHKYFGLLLDLMIFNVPKYWSWFYPFWEIFPFVPDLESLFTLLTFSPPASCLLPPLYMKIFTYNIPSSSLIFPLDIFCTCHSLKYCRTQVHASNRQWVQTNRNVGIWSRVRVWSRGRFSAGPSKENGWLMLKSPELSNSFWGRVL